MKNIRKYGKAPFNTAVLHGGPGAPGEVAAVAKELSKHLGVLGPLQSAKSVNGQVSELNTLISRHSSAPVVLVGYSWGAWLAILYASRYPKKVKKLILVSSGPLDDKYVEELTRTRLKRLNTSDQAEVLSLLSSVIEPNTKFGNLKLTRLGYLLSKTDNFKHVKPGLRGESFECQSDVFEKVWKEALNLRRNGVLIEKAKNIKCPITVIHGKYDPHPYLGVKTPLKSVLKKVKFILLPKCGHKPWIEKYASKRFYSLLNKEINTLH